MQLLGGRYQLVEPVGEGGMAVVWRATDKVLRRTVAVKLLASRLAADERFRNRVRQEAYTAAQLNHPHIANVYDYGETRHGRQRRKVPYLVMEFVEGGTLAHRLRESGALDWSEAVLIGADVAAALAAAHAAGLVHRDVKPANIMLSPAGVKVVDLGIAETIGGSTTVGTGEVLGTPRYMAPEQARGEAAGPGSDLYALGLLLIECLTGRPPAHGSTPTELIRQRQEGVGPEVPTVPGLPESIADLCRRCLAPAAADRPDAVEAFEALARVVGPRPLTVNAHVPPVAAVRTPSPPGDPADADTGALTGTGAMTGTGALTGAGPADRAGAPAPVRAGRGGVPVVRTAAADGGAADGPRRRRPRAGGDVGPRRGTGRRPLRRPLLLAAAPMAVLVTVLGTQLPGNSSDDPGDVNRVEAAPVAPTSGCAARYVARHDLDGSLTAQVTVTNAGTAPLPTWQLGFALPAGQQYAGSTDDVEVSQQNRDVVIRVDRPLAPGETTALSLQGTHDLTSAAAPREFSLNGATCEQAFATVTSASGTSEPTSTVDSGGVGAADSRSPGRPVPVEPTPTAGEPSVSPSESSTGDDDGDRPSPTAPSASPSPSTSPSPITSPSPPEPSASTDPDDEPTPEPSRSADASPSRGTEPDGDR
ncbi:protein kinase domain-containing protein [Micromonospora sp. SH-82]|uniref:protein kinase domain-containing protein n=1 Tax=Micromonospora sp. SH-82 TaxID=3132938 RepID=UPI003EBCA94B